MKLSGLCAAASLAAGAFALPQSVLADSPTGVLTGAVLEMSGTATIARRGADDGATHDVGDDRGRGRGGRGNNPDGAGHL